MHLVSLLQPNSSQFYIPIIYLFSTIINCNRNNKVTTCILMTILFGRNWIHIRSRIFVCQSCSTICSSKPPDNNQVFLQYLFHSCVLFSLVILYLLRRVSTAKNHSHAKPSVLYSLMFLGFFYYLIIIQFLLRFASQKQKPIWMFVCVCEPNFVCTSGTVRLETETTNWTSIGPGNKEASK